MDEVYCPKCSYKYLTFMRIYRHTDRSSEKFYYCDSCERNFQIVETTDNNKITRKIISTPSPSL
jgi:DNA-directed RNA polymerase subunit RPC12/RpoP